MLTKIKTQLKTFVKNLGDLRFVGQVVFVIIILLTSWSGIKAIQTNYELQKRIARLQQEVEVQRLENQNLALENQYLETDRFLELAARRQFGKGAPGEKVYIVPSNVALAHTIDATTTVEEDTEQKAEKPAYQQNLEDWVNFFFRKSDNKLLSSS